MKKERKGVAQFDKLTLYDILYGFSWKKIYRLVLLAAELSAQGLHS